MSSCPTRTTRDVAEGTTGRPLRVVFVCLGNICRSPIAERVAERAAADAGITGVEFSSAGTISEEYDDPMDRRAAAVLRGARIPVRGPSGAPDHCGPDRVSRPRRRDGGQSSAQRIGAGA